MFWSRKYLSRHSGVGANTRADIAPKTREKLCCENFLRCFGARLCCVNFLRYFGARLCCNNFLRYFGARLCRGNFSGDCGTTTMLQPQTDNTVVPTHVPALCRNPVPSARCVQAFSSSDGGWRSASSCHLGLAPIHAPLCHNWETVHVQHSLRGQCLCSKHGL